MSTKKAFLEGLRFHAMKFIADTEVNPYDRSQFERPVKLHRRFPRDTPNQPVVTNPEDDKERELDAIRKAEKQAEREATQAQIAPTDKTIVKKKGQQPFKKKTQDVLYPTDTPEAKKRAQLRYEEGRPWHLEDFENKNIWVGTYEEPLSETNAMFLLDSNGSFRMVPIEKWYRFNPTQRYKTMTVEEAERHMARKVKDSRWFLENEETSKLKRAELERQARLNYGRVGMRGENRRKKSEEDEGDNDMMDFADDVDELDFEADEEFQDDDEGKLFGDDEEEAKEAANKLKKERHEANIFAGTGVKEDKDWFEEEDLKKQKEREERKKAKKLRKKLIKIEKNYGYDTDDSDNPYSEEVSLLHIHCELI